MKKFLMFGLFTLFLSMMTSYAAPPQVITTVDEDSGGYCFVQQETIAPDMAMVFAFHLMPAMAGEEVVIKPQLPRICNIRYARLKGIYLPIDLTGTSDPPGYSRAMKYMNIRANLGCNNYA